MQGMNMSVMHEGQGKSLTCIEVSTSERSVETTWKRLLASLGSLSSSIKSSFSAAAGGRWQG